MAFSEFAYLNSFWQLDPILLPLGLPSIPEARMFEDGNTYGPSTQDPPLPNSVARWEQNGTILRYGWPSGRHTNRKRIWTKLDTSAPPLAALPLSQKILPCIGY